MFLDSATQRSSVVSHAKLLNYTPKSAIAPTAIVNVRFNNVTAPSLTLPAWSVFTSSSINGVNYTFVNPTSYTANTVGGTVNFSGVEIKQGVRASYKFTVDSTANPEYVYEVPDNTIDNSTLQVTVQESSTNSSYEVYTQSTQILTLDGSSKVFFLEESMKGNYNIRFGDGIIGKKLTDGNVIRVNYISTEGTSAAGANSFALMQTVSGFAPSSVTPVMAATQGGDKETIDSIKYHAPKAHSSQNRAITTDDYIYSIQNNNLGISFDAVSVWGGEQNDPPAYGRVFVSLKPTGGMNLTQIQKQQLIKEAITPISVMTVQPTIVDPDYTYLKLGVNVLYDPKRTILTADQIKTIVQRAINNYSNATLNTFNSSFSVSDLIIAIQKSDPSIISNEIDIKLQKKFFPILQTTRNYTLYFGAPLQKNNYLSGITSTPSFQVYSSTGDIINNVYLEEVASSTNYVESISISNPGFGYQYPPKVAIIGDGTGATAEATINTNGSVTSVKITNPGVGYTTAYVTFTPVLGDTTGQSAAGVVGLQGRYGTIRTFYNNISAGKTVINDTAGTIDYTNGIVTLTNFNPLNVNNDLGQLTLTATPTTTLISSSYNRIITVDTFDTNAITVNVTAKT